MSKFDNLIVSQTVEADRFWIIGDIHGMYNQFHALLKKITEFELNPEAKAGFPVERVAIVSVGDLCDRGPDSLETLHLCYYLRSTQGWPIGDRAAMFYNVMGNHDHKLLRALSGAAVQPKHGLDKTLFQLEGTGVEMMKRYAKFLENSPLTVRLKLADGVEAVVVHAAFHPSFQTFGNIDRTWSRAHTAEYSLFGPVAGITPEGMPIRIAWETTYDALYQDKGEPRYVFYGHKVVDGVVPAFGAHTCNTDTGCFQTGVLSAVSFPDMHVIQVYGEPSDSKVL